MPSPSATPAPLPPVGNGSGGSGDQGSGVTPLPGDSTPPPPSGDAGTTPVPAPSAAPPAPAEPQLVVARPEADPSLLIPAALLGGALALLLALWGLATWARRSGHLPALGQAWQEASWRATGAWGDFSDWLRVGR
jgi:hypothetical protein